MAFANLGFGSLADALNAPVLFFLPGLAFTTIVLLTMVSGPHLRRLYRDGTVFAGT